MPKVAFMSHASEDAAIAGKVCEYLERHGVTCWIAPRDVIPGRDYSSEIIDGIETSQVFVLILSENANASSFVKREVERAVSKGKPVFPVRVREVTPSKSLELFISSAHWIDAWQPPLEQYLSRLAGSILATAVIDPKSGQTPTLGTPLRTAGPAPEAAGEAPSSARRRQPLVLAAIGVVLIGVIAYLAIRKPHQAPPPPATPPAMQRSSPAPSARRTAPALAPAQPDVGSASTPTKPPRPTAAKEKTGQQTADESAMPCPGLAYTQNWRTAEDPGGETPKGSSTTYYVSSSQGNDSQDGRSRTTPWRTLDKVTKTSLEPGDTILFKRGDVWKNQVLTFTSSGQSGKPITYGAYGAGNRPVIEVGTNISMDQQSWVVIDRLHFHKGRSLRIETSTHITLQNSEISHMDRTCLRVRDESRHVLVKQSKIHDCGVLSGGETKAKSGVNGEGIYIGSPASLKEFDRTGFVTIQANEIYDATDKGINVKENTHNILIENNVVHDLTTSAHGGINLRPVIGKNNTIRGNIVYNIKRHVNAGSRAGTGIVTGKGTHVYNNVVYNNQNFGIRTMSQSKVYNNTIYGNSSGDVELDDNDVDIRNNIGPELLGCYP